MSVDLILVRYPKSGRGEDVDVIHILNLNRFIVFEETEIHKLFKAKTVHEDGEEMEIFVLPRESYLDAIKICENQIIEYCKFLSDPGHSKNDIDEYLGRINLVSGIRSMIRSVSKIFNGSDPDDDEIMIELSY